MSFVDHLIALTGSDALLDPPALGDEITVLVTGTITKTSRALNTDDDIVTTHTLKVRHVCPIDDDADVELVDQVTKRWHAARDTKLGRLALPFTEDDDR
jgi:hypothetical protein